MTIRNVDGDRVTWALFILVLVFAEFVYRRFLDVEFTAFPLILLVLVTRMIYDVLVGKLVPAVCWGFMALDDDDRLKRDDPTRGEEEPR